MKTKHTKGNWSLPHLACESSECDCGSVCTVNWSKDRDLENGDNPPIEEAKANAKLIHAAPDLLEACIRSIELVDLWAPKYTKEEISECHIGELAALANMRSELEKAISKAIK